MYELPSMNGLRLPNLDVERSARAPVTGCISRDDKGPAIQIKDVRALVKPRLSKYGVQYDISSDQTKTIPPREQVRSAIRADSLEPRIDGLPRH